VVNGHYENFPVASVLLPAPMRRHVAAVYAFARTADDFADEGARTPEQRLGLLDGWQARLDAAAVSPGTPGSPPAPGEPPDAQAMFLALGATLHECRLPVSLFTDLLSAFRQDVATTRYATWDDLLDYCRRSANPVGRIVLGIAGVTDTARESSLLRQSDAVCTALQLTNFWQDTEADLARGRIYLPAETMQAHGATAEQLQAAAGGSLRYLPLEWRNALADAAGRTRTLYTAGRPVCDGVGGRLRYELRATWLGGARILDRLAARDFNVLRYRPTIGLLDTPWLAWRLLTWRPRSQP